MKKEQFKQKHKNLNIAQSELERKWRVLQEHEELQRIYEAMARQAHQLKITGAGGHVFALSLFTEIVPNNDFYFTFS